MNIYIRPTSTHKEAYKQTSILLGLPYSNAKLENITIDMSNHKILTMQLSVNRELPSNTNLKNITIYCPIGKASLMDSSLHGVMYILDISCSPCEENRYNITSGALRTDNKTANIKPFQYGEKASRTFTGLSANVIKSLSRKKCPVGGMCLQGITRTRGSFYGYIDSQDNIIYKSCLLNYCCDNSEKCFTYNTCQLNCEGFLC